MNIVSTNEDVLGHGRQNVETYPIIRDYDL